jgi:peptidoglycan/xylan/chitin deacetylase (PgdA/CDA1 family)
MKDYLKYTFEYYQDSGVAQAASSGYVYTGTSTATGDYERQLADSVPVLVYHRIIEEPDGFNITKEAFKEQLFALKKNGYNTVSLESLLAYMRGERELPEKSIVITFDDGAKDSFYNSDPVLKVLGFRAINFIITGHSLNGKPNNYYLDERELRAMLATGRWELGSHTDSGHGQVDINRDGDSANFLSNKIWIPEEDRLETDLEYKTRIEQDLRESKKKLEDLMGARVVGFAFPYGDYGHESRNVQGATNLIREVASAIYPMSFYQASSREIATNIPTKERAFNIRRITVRPEWKTEDLLSRLESLQ